MEKLYERFGRLMIQAEILDGQIKATKQKIADAINNQKKEPVCTKEPKEENPTIVDSEIK